jgi:integrase/recombinase XerC
MATESISRIVKGRLRDAGINDERLTAHSLRHTAATLNLLNGGSLEETQKLLRHERISTTMIYSHALDNVANKSASRVAAAIFA